MKLVETGVGADGRSRVVRVVPVAPPDPMPGSDLGVQAVFDGPPDGGVAAVAAGAQSAARLHDARLRGATAWRAVRYVPGGTTDVHRTTTVDYDVCLDGSVVLELEDGEVALEPGDMAVVAGVAHRWRAGPRGALLSALMVRPDLDGPPR